MAYVCTVKSITPDPVLTDEEWQAQHPDMKLDNYPSAHIEIEAYEDDGKPQTFALCGFSLRSQDEFIERLKNYFAAQQAPPPPVIPDEIAKLIDQPMKF